MNSARARAVEDGLSGVARKVLAALAFADYRTQHEITAELTRQRQRADQSIISGCLQSLTRSGLVREWEGRYKRIHFEDKKPMNSVVAMPSTARHKPAPEPEVRAPDLPDRMAAVANTLRSVAAEIDVIAVAMLDREKLQADEIAKLAQLKALLSSIGGGVMSDELMNRVRAVLELNETLECADERDLTIRDLMAKVERLAAEAALGPAPISHEWPACGCKITPPALCDDAHHWVLKVECAESERDEARAEAERMAARLREMETEVERLRQRDRELWTLAGKLKGCGDPVIDACMGTADPTFTAFIATLPEAHWSKYDLSAARIGWHHGRLALTRELAGAEPVAWRYTDARGHFRYRGVRPGFDSEYPTLRPEALIRRPEMPK